jgi:hypothetical protein
VKPQHLEVPSPGVLHDIYPVRVADNVLFRSVEAGRVAQGPPRCPPRRHANVLAATMRPRG